MVLRALNLLVSSSLNQMSVVTATWVLDTDQRGRFLSAGFHLFQSQVQINLQHAALISSVAFVFKILASLEGYNILFTVACFSI